MRLPALLLAVLLVAGCTKPLTEFRERENQATGPGQAALDFIRAPRILVELDVVAGSEPNAQALTDFETEAERVLGVPVDIQIVAEVAGRGATHSYTLDEIDALELAHRDMYTDGDRAVLYMLWLDGHFENANALGVAYHGSSVAMFKGTIRDNSKEDDQILLTPSTLTLPEERYVERAVAVHELGHVLGLVNNGVPMVRAHEMTQDPMPDTPRNEGEAHSRNEESVMFWAVDTQEILTVFTNGEDIPWRFDADDRADLQAAKDG